MLKLALALVLVLLAIGARGQNQTMGNEMSSNSTGSGQTNSDSGSQTESDIRRLADFLDSTANRIPVFEEANSLLSGSNGKGGFFGNAAQLFDDARNRIGQGGLLSGFLGR